MSNLTNNTEELQNVLAAVKALPEAGKAEPVLQEKRVTPTETPKYVEPDDGYDGLSKVTVGAIPSAFIRPEGTLTITENGTTADVSEYEKVNVSIPMGSRTFTANGVYLASDFNCEGFSAVTVAVPEVPASSGSTVSVRAGSSVNGHSLYFIAPNGYKGVLSSGQIVDTVGGIVIQSDTTQLSTSGLIFSTIVGNCRVYYFGEGGYFR